MQVVFLSNIPRNRKQVYNQASKIENRIRSRSTGPQKAADFTKLVTQRQTSDFVKDVSFGLRHGKDTSPNTFAANDLHIKWLKIFCSGTSPKSQCGINITYNCGPSYLTTSTFPHPMFVYGNARDKHLRANVSMHHTNSGKSPKICFHSYFHICSPICYHNL